MKFLCCVCITIIVLSTLRVFSGLGHQSLWIDELFTAYFADPQLSSLSSVLARAAEDVHPPGYYIILWLVLRIVDGDFAVIARGLTASAAILALVCVYFAPSGSLRWQAKLVSVAVAVLCWAWWYFAQEARSYGIVYCLVSFSTLSGLRSRDLLAMGRNSTVWLTALVLCSICMVFIHYYTLLVSGAIFGVLLLTCTKWSQRFLVVCSGLTVLLCAILFITWQMPRIVVDVDNTWFKAEAKFILEHLIRGVSALVTSAALSVFGVLFWVLAILIICGRKPIFFMETLGPDLRVGIRFLSAIMGLTVFLGIAVSVFFLPVFSFRLFLVLAPVFWIFLAYILEWIFRLTTHPEAVRALTFAVPMALAASFSVVGVAVLSFVVPPKSPWKFSANYVASLGTCTSGKIPISWFEQPHISEDDPERFYGYYLEPNSKREWLRLPQDRIEEEIRSAEFERHILKVIENPDECPILLWSMHFIKFEGLTTIAGYLEKTLEANGYRDAELDVLFLKNGASSALMLLHHEANTDPKSICSTATSDPACEYWMDSQSRFLDW